MILSTVAGFTILPVFAGMIPLQLMVSWSRNYSPRIRGDGPKYHHPTVKPVRFSPYSRGWSGLGGFEVSRFLILPVFAGMVPRNRNPQAA